MGSKLHQTENVQSESGLENKPGRLSKKEKLYIDGARARGESIADIARAIRKNENIVEAYLFTNDEKVTNEQYELIEGLRAKAEYSQFKKEFSREEMSMFEYEYARLMPQFIEGLTPTEEDQVYTMIRLKIDLYRNAIERNRAQFDLEEGYRLLDEARENPESDNTEQRRALMQHTTYIDGVKLQQKEIMSQYNSLLQRQQAIWKDLKSTREQRIKKIEDKTVNFGDILKSLMDKDQRERQGKEIDIMRKATEEEKKRLGQPHTYLDGYVDRPIYNKETV